MKHPHYDIIVWVADDPENNAIQRKEPDGSWCDITLLNLIRFPFSEYRRKPASPKRITINGVEINAPLSEAPHLENVCWHIGCDSIFQNRWFFYSWQKDALANGRIFDTEQDAQAAYDAITLALTGGKQ